MSTLSGRMSQVIQRLCLHLTGHLPWELVVDTARKESCQMQPRQGLELLISPHPTTQPRPLLPTRVPTFLPQAPCLLHWGHKLLQDGGGLLTCQRQKLPTRQQAPDGGGGRVGVQNQSMPWKLPEALSNLTPVDSPPREPDVCANWTAGQGQGRSWFVGQQTCQGLGWGRVKVPGEEQNKGPKGENVRW